ncbi:glycoside hydrolase family 9 protein [Asticcacaulis sp. AND118]|uniref:glycoside hydrolase family 9 protein n=1 Tax=Asticcacaulis sp. AND118 TaxID=2840468 RepID=UPI001D001093|nr:glycoside hydrolase family 9 protein [Asticcacaulis sp. AND118]UDF04698.1 glycoside hydrolase family 9 protein [Asticcacaulis sp. AND118]
MKQALLAGVVMAFAGGAATAQPNLPRPYQYHYMEFPTLNQTGFQPQSPKIAVYAVPEDAPAPAGREWPAVDWVVKDAVNTIVLSGRSEPFGLNAGSGKVVYQIDFSALTTPGSGYVVGVKRGDSYKVSAPFDIRADVYQSLKYDALAFFYHQRVSVPIEATYVGERFARPVAHAKEIVTCWGPKDHRGNHWGGCPYTLDVSKGWYDAGDQGKYVVNGGISVWTLMNAYEVAREKGDTSFDDGRVKIPEAGNGVNDLLDEVRFEMDFLLAMQVPESQTLNLPLGDQHKSLDKLKFTRVDASGMAHHKMHDEHWTPVPTLPHEDREKRGLSYPSTAATLNLAAVAAQCARVFKSVDDAYADRCLTAAKKAYAAAKRVPDAYAIDVLPGGGGGYGDGHLSDEFYWAAAELYATTGEAAYLADLKASPHALSVADFNWGQVDTPGTLTLASVDTPWREAARKAVIARADALKNETAGQGYRIAFDRSYVWGSTADVMNRAMILARAADFSGHRAYRDEALNLMDYVLGRNPLNFSYVSGYGERAMQHPHHRFWANDGKLPPPPPGVIAGGPNQNPGDPDAQAALKGCAPQICYVDLIGSYSTNEVAINWNAPLFWVAAWLDGTRK